jgi:hypothetical protein
MCFIPGLPWVVPSKPPAKLHQYDPLLSCPRCPWAYLSHRQRRFSLLGGPVLSRAVSSLLGQLLHEELALRWEQLLLDEAFTGGALAWIPGRTAEAGQLVFPAGGALDRLRILSHCVEIPWWKKCFWPSQGRAGSWGLQWPKPM